MKVMEEPSRVPVSQIGTSDASSTPSTRRASFGGASSRVIEESTSLGQSRSGESAGNLSARSRGDNSARRMSSSSIITETRSSQGAAAEDIFPLPPGLSPKSQRTVTINEEHNSTAPSLLSLPEAREHATEPRHNDALNYDLVPESSMEIDAEAGDSLGHAPLRVICEDHNDITEGMGGLSIRDYFLLRRETGLSPTRPFSPSSGHRKAGVERPLSRSARAFEELIRRPSCSVGELERAFETQFRYFANRDARTLYKLLSKSMSDSRTITLSTRKPSRISLADIIPYYDPQAYKDVKKGLVVIFDPTLDTKGLNYCLEASYALGDRSHLLRTNISNDGLTEGLEISGARWSSSADRALLPCHTGDPMGERTNWLPGWAGVSPLFIPADECHLTLSIAKRANIPMSRPSSCTSGSTWMHNRSGSKTKKKTKGKDRPSSSSSTCQAIGMDFLSSYPLAPPEFIADSVPRSPPRSAPCMFVQEPEFQEPNELNTLRAPIVYFEADSMHKAMKLLNTIVYPQLRAFVASGGSGSGVGHLNIAAMHGNMDAVRFLVESINADVNSRCAASMFTPLHEAAQNGHTEILKYLLSKGANPVLVDANGRTPLHLSCIASNIPATRVLLECEQWRKVAFLRDNNGRSMRQLCTSKFILSLIDDCLHRHHAFRLFMTLEQEAEEEAKKKKRAKKLPRSGINNHSSAAGMDQMNGTAALNAPKLSAWRPTSPPSGAAHNTQRPVSASGGYGSNTRSNVGAPIQQRPGTAGATGHVGLQSKGGKMGKPLSTATSSAATATETIAAPSGPHNFEDLIEQKMRLLYGANVKGKKLGGVAWGAGVSHTISQR